MLTFPSLLAHAKIKPSSCGANDKPLTLLSWNRWTYAVCHTPGDVSLAVWNTNNTVNVYTIQGVLLALLAKLTELKDSIINGSERGREGEFLASPVHYHTTITWGTRQKDTKFRVRPAYLPHRSLMPCQNYWFVKYFSCYFIHLHSAIRWSGR